MLRRVVMSVVPVCLMGAVTLFTVASATAWAANSGVVGWGDNPYDQLGSGASVFSRPFTLAFPDVPSEDRIKQVAAGGTFTLALIEEGGSNVVVAWGSNTSEQLGQNPESHPNNPEPTPVTVTGLPSDVTMIAAGYGFGLALAEGKVWAWGSDTNGVLGTSKPSPHWKPKVVESGEKPLEGVTDISAGHSGVQPFALALKGGHVFAWGSNEWGQLGNGTTTATDEAVEVAGLTEATEVAAGSGSGMALQNKHVWTWGRNSWG